MRYLLIITIILIVLPAVLFAQNDFVTLDKQTYDYYLKGDYKNLKVTGDKMLSSGIDYYYLRMRMGILAFNNQRYSSSFKHFTKAIQFNSWDTVSRGYIYSSYLLSGRKNDASFYLETIPWDKRNKALRSIEKHLLQEAHITVYAANYDAKYYDSRVDNYEALENSLITNLGFESLFSSNSKGTFVYTNVQKKGISYSSTNSTGVNLDYSQNQLYFKLTGFKFPGWEFSGFGHIAFYSVGSSQSQHGGRNAAKQFKSEYLGGVGILKNGWRVRSGINASVSNFGGSSQVRGDVFITYLPFGNLNFYLTSGGMYQFDKNWGGTYQLNQEFGFKLLRFFWLESGVVAGNSFLYARNQGLLLNNSFQIPVTTVYGNFIFLLGKKFSITLSPQYNVNHIYTWDLNDFNRYDKLSLNSFGGSIKLTFKN